MSDGGNVRQTNMSHGPLFDKRKDQNFRLSQKSFSFISHARHWSRHVQCWCLRELLTPSRSYMTADCSAQPKHRMQTSLPPGDTQLTKTVSVQSAAVCFMQGIHNVSMSHSCNTCLPFLPLPPLFVGPFVPPIYLSLISFHEAFFWGTYFHKIHSGADMQKQQDLNVKIHEALNKCKMTKILVKFLHMLLI